MAAIPFPCNGHLLCCVNIPTVLLMFFNKFASCSIPYFFLIFFFYCERPSFGFEQFSNVQFYCVTNSFFTFNVGKKKRKLAKPDFFKQLGHF